MMPHILTIDVQQAHVDLVWGLDARYGMTPFHPALLDRFGKSTIVTVDTATVHIEQPDGQKTAYDLTPEAANYLIAFQEAVLDAGEAFISKAFAPVAFTLEIHQDNPMTDPHWEEKPTKGAYYKLATRRLSVLPEHDQVRTRPKAASGPRTPHGFRVLTGSIRDHRARRSQGDASGASPRSAPSGG